MTEPSVPGIDVRPSSIEGLGIFARQPIRAGERFREITVVREVTPDTPLRQDLGERADHCDYPDGKVVLLGVPDRYVNHNCDPNAWLQYLGARCCFVARRDINADEEITCDYSINLTGGSSWPCHPRDGRRPSRRRKGSAHPSPIT